MPSTRLPVLLTLSLRAAAWGDAILMAKQSPRYIDRSALGVALSLALLATTDLNRLCSSKTELARRTRQIVDRARRGEAVIVESYGEEQVAVIDAIDYRILSAVAAYLGVVTPDA